MGGTRPGLHLRAINRAPSNKHFPIGEQHPESDNRYDPFLSSELGPLETILFETDTLILIINWLTHICHCLFVGKAGVLRCFHLLTLSSLVCLSLF